MPTPRRTRTASTAPSSSPTKNRASSRRRPTTSRAFTPRSNRSSTSSLIAISRSTARDIFRYYRSDAAAAIEAGANTRAALVGFGLDGSHGWERTHIDSLEAAYNLLHAWLQTPLTFAKWDAKPTGSLRDFPSSKQPAPSERWVPLSRGDYEGPGDASPGTPWPPSEGPQA